MRDEMSLERFLRKVRIHINCLVLKKMLSDDASNLEFEVAGKAGFPLIIMVEAFTCIIIRA